MEPSTALVTGASRGIGRAVALELARRGHRVVATMRDPSRGRSLEVAAEELPGHIDVDRLDVTDPATITVPDQLRILVNNAAIELANRSVEDTPLADWRATFETNVFGLVEVTRRALPGLRATPGGVVCNISSAGLIVPTPFYAVYRASKAAVSALGESLRLELAPHGGRVVEVLPGPIDTDMLAGSSVTPEAVESPPYRALAERMATLRAATIEGATAVGEAARRIVDAIEDPSVPQRVACDDLGAALLAGWEAQSGEATIQASLDAFRVEG